MAFAGQSVDHRSGGDAGHVHGGARYQHRQCGAAPHRRQSFGGSGREYVDINVLSRLQCDRAAAERLVVFDHRPEALLHGLCRVVHDQFVSVRTRAQSRHADLLPRYSGRGRRRLATEFAGHPRRYLSSRQTRHGIRRVWDRGGDGSGRRPYAWRLAHRQLQLALDFLYQYPSWHSFAFAEPTAHSGSSVLQAPQAERNPN